MLFMLGLYNFHYIITFMHTSKSQMMQLTLLCKILFMQL